MQNLLAVLGSAGFLAAVPILFYVGMMVWYEDMGGPLNLVIVPVGSVFLGLVISITLYLPLSRLREHRSRILSWIVLGSASLPVGFWVYLISLHAPQAPTRDQLFTLILMSGGFYLYLLFGFLVHLLWLAGLRWWVNRSRSVETQPQH